MKVAISAQRQRHRRAGRSQVRPRSLVHRRRLRGGAWQAHDNTANVDASGGAGVQAGTTVVAQGAGAVITGNVGPNAHKVLAAAGIAIYQAGNGVTARDALAALRRGELAAVEAPTVSGQWTCQGMGQP